MAMPIWYVDLNVARSGSSSRTFEKVWKLPSTETRSFEHFTVRTRQSRDMSS